MRAAALVTISMALCGCEAILGLSPRTLDAGQDSGVSGCTKQADCDQPDASWVCVPSSGQCVEALSPDCTELAGADLHKDTVLLATLFSLQGSQAATNQARNSAVKLAVSELNRYGGIPRADGRKLVTLLVCDATNLLPAARHLSEDLQVPAIIGPNFSQDVLTVTNEVARANHTVLVTPSALAGAISTLDDGDFTWRLIPSDVQRVPPLVRRINEVEDSLRDAGVGRVRLAMLARNDVQGAGTSTELNQVLQVNDAGLSALSNQSSVYVKLYDPTKTNQADVVSALLAFRPDIVVGAGTAELVTQIMAPFEAGLDGGTRRPQYALTDSAKVSDLLTFVGGAGVAFGVRERISGTGFSPAPEAMQNYSNFVFDYQTFTGTTFPNLAGMGPAYDATYAIAFALASQPAAVPSGDAVLTGLRRLSATGQRFNTGPLDLQSAFNALATGAAIDPLGTYGLLEFDSNGDVLGSRVETWCLARDPGTGAVAYTSAGEFYNTKTGQFSGAFTPCP